LCIVRLSESVMTRKKRPPSSSTLPQKRYRFVPLKLCTNGRANDSNAHVLGQVRSLAQNLIFKIWRELIVGHASSILRRQRARKNILAEKEKLGARGFRLRVGYGTTSDE